MGFKRRRWAVAAVVLMATAGLPAGSPAAQEIPTDPKELLFTVLETVGGVVPPDLPDPLAGIVDPLNPACDQLDPSACMFPFPSDHWTVADPSTPTGRRVNLDPLAVPRNVAAIPMTLPAVPNEWNRQDGFSPGTDLLAFFPGLDLTATWGLGDRPERYQQQMTDPALSLAADAPIVIVDAESGERHPFFAELDTHPDTDPTAATLIIRPATNFTDGHRYVIGFRNLVTGDGGAIGADGLFADLRDGLAGGARQQHFDDAVFPVLADAGLGRDSLVMAWDFTIASTQNLAGRLLSMRDETFAALGDTDLDDGVVDGVAPTFSVTSVDDRSDPTDDTLREVRGELTVPNYLTNDDSVTVPVPEVGDFAVPLARLVYDSLTPGPNDTPIVNPLLPTRSVPFVCSIPRTVETEGPAAPTLYGHGLLGSKNESTGGSTRGLRQNNHMPCAVDWTGMATGDLVNVALLLADIGLFPSMADRIQQGFLEFLVLGRALAHPDGLAAHQAFDVDGAPAFDPSGLVFDGNSQGAILGGGLAAFGVDFTRVVLGVPGMNYSTLLNRSNDWEGEYGEVLYTFYPNKRTQQLVLNLIQMLWDRGETNGYATHLTSDPLPDTPPKQVLLQVGFGDHQVTNLAAEVMGRSMDARRITGDLPDCRHWAVDQYWGFAPNDPAATEPAVLAYYDSGTPTPPNGNRAPHDLGEDPHGDPRNDPLAIDQKIAFFETGQVVEPHAGGHARTDRWPERAGDHLAEVEAQLTDGCLDFLSGPAAVLANVATPATAPGSLPATGRSSPLAVGLAIALMAFAVSARRRSSTSR